MYFRLAHGKCKRILEVNHSACWAFYFHLPCRLIYSFSPKLTHTLGFGGGFFVCLGGAVGGFLCYFGGQGDLEGW